MVTPAQNRDAALAQRLATEHGERLVDAVTRAESGFTRDDLIWVVEHARWAKVDPTLPKIQGALAGAIADHVLADATAVDRRIDPQTGQPLFINRRLEGLEQEMLATGLSMADEEARYLTPRQLSQVMTHYDRYMEERPEKNSREYRAAFESLQQPGELKVLEGPPGAHKSEMIKLLARAFNASPRGKNGIIVTALSERIAALGAGEAGHDAVGTPFEALLEGLENGTAPIQPGGLLLVDEAGMLGSREMHQLLQAAQKAKLRTILIGDLEQIPPLTAGQPLRKLAEALGPRTAVLTETYRQRNPDDRQATMALRAGDAKAALDSYSYRGHLAFTEGPRSTLSATTRAYANFVDDAENEKASAVILTTTAAEAAMANQMVRHRLHKLGHLGEDWQIMTAEGTERFAKGDQIMLRERWDDAEGPVWPGSTAEIREITAKTMTLRLEGKEKRELTIDVTDMPDMRHAYALDLRTAQGIKADQIFFAVTRRLDRGEALVGFSRHRQGLKIQADATVYPSVEAMAQDFAVARPKPLSLDLPRPPMAAASGATPMAAASGATPMAAASGATPMAAASGAPPMAARMGRR